MNKKTNIFGKTKEEITEICIIEGFQKYTGKQISEWMYKKRVTSFENMTNLSLEQRSILSKKYNINPLAPVETNNSSDGTIKYLFQTTDGFLFETVIIPDEERLTVCISTQTGCVLSCSFCQTGKANKSTDLIAGDIISQILFIPEFEKITNIVIMGMGEPLLNWENVKTAINLLTSEEYIGISKRRITLSTVGIIPNLKDFLQSYPCELAISMHTPFAEQRKQIMPIENKYPIEEVIHLIRRYTSGSNRIVSFEYIVFKDFNHSEEHVEKLSELLAGIPCKINLMSFHPVENFEMYSSEREEIEKFQNALKGKGFIVTIRKSRGEDINAACGMLSAKKKK